jgi:hypothetical protein
MGKTWEARVAEYGDSPLLFHRIRLGDTISCEIDGSEGVYQVAAVPAARGTFSCTCPSEIQPCKHIAALRETFARRPDSFYDAGALLKRIERKTAAELRGLIRDAIIASPGFVAAIDPTAFGDDEDSPDTENG